MKTRINKYLAKCGMGSRRKVEELVNEGLISVNGQVVTDLSLIVDEDSDTVTYRNRLLSPISSQYYIILNKPKGYITTMSDEKGRPTVMDIIPEKYRRAGVCPVGRLDKDTEGLLLLTNDGELANLLNRPVSHIEKEYLVELDRPLEDRDRKKIEAGVFIHQLKLKTRRAKLTAHPLAATHITMIISEGKKRQIRYVFKNFGYNVKRLRRNAYGPLTLKELTG
jgi:pseudouridine synthase